MDVDDATDTAVDRLNFLLNRLFEPRPIPMQEEEEEQEEETTKRRLE